MKKNKLEEFIGISGYLSKTEGIGGKIREKIEDFVVEEITPEGKILEVGRDYGFKIGKRSRYVVFLLEKHGWDTFRAFETLAEHLNVNPENFSFAGIKDKQAITIQRVSVWGIKPEDLRKIRINGLYIRGCWYSDEKVYTGNLWGNHFQITIRKINLEKNEVERRISRILDEVNELGGIPNFFGFQRFGTRRPTNHIIGKCIVKGLFKEAVIRFLTETSPYEDEHTREARQKLKENMNFKDAAKMFPSYLWYEKRMLEHLSRHPRGYISALRLIPKQLRIMFTHSYTSYIFNKLVSYKMKTKTLNEVFEGDFVLEIDESGLPANEPCEATSYNLKELREKVKEGKFVVALPLIGYKVKIPRGVTGDIIKDILEEEEVRLEDFYIKSMPELSVKGTYRAVLLKIRNFEVPEIMRDELSPSMLKTLMCFSVPKGGYATIVLREFMKPHDPVSAGFLISN